MLSFQPSSRCSVRFALCADSQSGGFFSFLCHSFSVGRRLSLYFCWPHLAAFLFFRRASSLGRRLSFTLIERYVEEKNK